MVGLALGQQLLRHLGMTLGAGDLADHFAIVIQAQPGQALEDRLGRFGGRAGAVGIFDAQQELAAARAGIEPVEQRRACPADMQKAGRRGGKTGDDRVGHGGIYLMLTRRG